MSDRRPASSGRDPGPSAEVPPKRGGMTGRSLRAGTNARRVAVVVLLGLAASLGAAVAGYTPSTLFSSWAEVHGAVMGLAFGLFVAAVGRASAGERWLFPLGLVVGAVVGLNLNVSPWEGWWHAWYVLLPFALVVYVAFR